MEEKRQGRARQSAHRETAQHQSTRGRHGRAGFVIGTIVLIGFVTCCMIGGIFMLYVKTTLAPSLDVDATDYTMNQSSIIYYQDKETSEWVELQTLHGEENRILVDYDQIPETVWQAAVAIEDERFFSHHGVDWPRTIKATMNLFLGGDSRYGGSTITQQLLKNMTKDNQNTVKRKVTEIFRALEFEGKYSKQEILELYLNFIYLGKGCSGVQTAAQYYFGKDVEELDLAESACLIAITNNPSLYGPFSTVKITNSETGEVRTARQMNKARQELILDKMADEETGLCFITPEERDAAKAEELQFVERTTNADKALAEDGTLPATAYQSYFVDQVRRDVVNDMAEELGISTTLAEQRLLCGGYHIYTTLDPDIQAIAEEVYYDRGNLDVTSAKGQRLQSGITIVDVANGNVVAMVGGVGQKEGDMCWNYAVDVQQCGSSIKPLSVYAPALDAGAVTMASTFDNYPVRLLNGSPWPKNSPQGYTGWTTLARGVASSINTVAVQVIEKLGVNASFKFLTENLGMTTFISNKDDASHNDINTASLGLGGLTRGVTTEQMAAAYASFANDGIYNSPRLYSLVTDADGNTVLENKTETHAAMKETTAYFMNQLLQGVVSNGTGGSADFGGMAIAGKTGTTSDNYDRYFVGYTPYYAAAVWTGYKNNEYIKYSGNPSITMWKKVMSKIHDELEYKSFHKPSSGLSAVSVCMDSGLLPTDACECDIRGASRVHSVTVAAGTEPTEPCNLHTLIDYCTEGKCIAGEFCPEESVITGSALDYVREDYGEGITADDNAYLLATLQAIEACPVHTAAAEDPAGSGGEGGASSGGGGSSAHQPVDPGTPTDPDTPVTPPEEDPSGGFGDANWWQNNWGRGESAEPKEPSP